MKDNISPEERLLRLIRGPKKQDLDLVKKSSPDILEDKPIIKPSRSSYIQKYLSNLLNFRKIIWIIFGLSCLYLIISFIWPSIALKKIKMPELTQEEIKQSKLELPKAIKPYEFYLEGIQGRQIFSSPTTPEISEKKEPLSTVNVAELIKNINLVGIIAGENPQAIVEDKKSQKAYYLNKGQFLGEFQVEDIKEGSIVLNYKGQRFELYL